MDDNNTANRDLDDDDTATAMFMFLDESVASSIQAPSMNHQNTQNHQNNHQLDGHSVLSRGDSIFQESMSLTDHSRPQENSTNKKNEIPVDVYMSKLRTQLICLSNFDPSATVTPAAALSGVNTLPELLCFVTQTHSQTSEVMEQALLLIQHLSSKSSLARFQLVETGLPLILTRFLDTQPPSVYIVALGEMCSELLEI
jgi:hypothetical protein